MYLHRKITLDDAGDFIEYRSGMCRTVEILDIAVGSARRKGRGRLLVNRMLEELRELAPTTSTVYAITRISNAIAHQFYEALGFRLLGRMHYFYRDGGDDKEHALIYGLDL